MQRIMFVLLSLALLGLAEADCNQGCTNCFGIICQSCDEGYALFQYSCYPCPLAPFCGTCSATKVNSNQVKTECTGPSKVASYLLVGLAVAVILCCCCMCSRGSSQRAYRPKQLTAPIYPQYQGPQYPVVGYGNPFPPQQPSTTQYNGNPSNPQIRP